MRYTLINIVGFEIGWFACVLGAGQGYPLLGPLVVAVLLGTRLVLIANAGPTARLVVITGVFGSLIDSLLAAAGAYAFVAPLLAGWLCPLWITALWMNFATLPRTSLAWLGERYALAALLGALGGPLSYYAGARLGAVTLHATPA
jgi:hypothetical protein